MIRLGGKTEDGRPIAVLGIDRENVRRLKKGQPIGLNLKELTGLDVEVVIFYGETPEDCISAVRSLGVTTPLDDRRPQ